MRQIFKVVGIVAFVAMVTAAIAVHKAPTQRLSLYKQALTQYADRMPIMVCDDLHATACRLVADDFTTKVPTPLPAPLTFDAEPNIMAAEPVASPKLGSEYASAVLQFIWPIILPILAGFVVDVLMKIRAYFGQATSDAQRDKLRQIAENGLNLAGHKLDVTIATGKLSLPTKTQLMAEAVDYVQAHGAETIKALGMDPTDPKTVEAIKGHVATLLAQKQADSSATSA